MAGASLLTLIDDIATLLDDVSVMTKVAAQKTAGVLGDDLALNAQQVSGVNPDRELPVVWGVAKGSMVNKAILVPAALAISAFIPWAITPLLMLGGAYLCFEGFEKLAHPFLHQNDPADQQHDQDLREAVADPKLDLVKFEQDKIKGAVRTDFILSAEIIAITLGTVAAAPFISQVAVLCGIAMIMTVGVYGFVAAIVKLDDLGLYLSQKSSAISQHIGKFLLAAAPLLMKTLSVLGTAAMFTVGGGIITHGFHALSEGIEHLAHRLGTLPAAGRFLEGLTPILLDAVVGLITGAITLGIVMLFGRLFNKKEAQHA